MEPHVSADTKTIRSASPWNSTSPGYPQSGCHEQHRRSIPVSQCIIALLPSLPRRDSNTRTPLAHPADRKSLRIPLFALWNLHRIQDREPQGYSLHRDTIATHLGIPGQNRQSSHENVPRNLTLQMERNRPWERAGDTLQIICSRGIPSSINITGIFSRIGYRIFPSARRRPPSSFSDTSF